MSAQPAFELPERLEAHAPPEARGLARDDVRMLVARGDGRLVHARARGLPDFLRAGDLVVINTSATLPAAHRLSAYETAYATEPGSAEMPSAGRPVTPAVLTALAARGVTVAPIVLHTGVSSPERGERPYPERFRVPAATARLVQATRGWGGRVIAIGTTVVRALETVAGTDRRVEAGPGGGAWCHVVQRERGGPMPLTMKRRGLLLIVAATALGGLAAAAIAMVANDSGPAGPSGVHIKPLSKGTLAASVHAKAAGIDI